MAIFRNVNMSFWTDTKIVDDYTPKDKYFMLYVLTNPYTNIIGCYEISIKQMSNDLGYTKDVVESLINRFKTHHKTIDYDLETKELYIKNWYKYNWNASPKLDPLLFDSIENIKSDLFHDKIAEVYNGRDSVNEVQYDKNNRVIREVIKIPYRYGIKKKAYPIDTTISIPISSTSTSTNTISNTNNINNNSNKIKYNNIISRLNKLTNSNYKCDARSNVNLIDSLLKDYSEEDILMVIDKMCYLWGNPKKGEKDMRLYLRPSTLFRKSNFDNYYGLNIPEKKLTTKDLNIDISDF